MLTLNGKNFEINLDIRWGTQKLMRKILNDKQNENNERYTEYIIKDILIPEPTKKEMLLFRRSDIENIFKAFADETKSKDKDFKKKLSR